jgi:FkbM family methyltransferase
MYEQDLIYDVGLNDGGDTAYYLHRGYRVVAIEAHPTLAEDGRRRFADAIRDGRLTILNVAIAPEEGIAQLIVNEQDSGRNTLNTVLPKTPDWAGVPIHTLEVRAVRFKDVLAEYGIPYYLKVDIETFDRYCLEDLDPSDLPRYVSFEVQNIRDLITVRDKGYAVYKIIRQQDHRQAFYDSRMVKAAAEQEPAGWPALVQALGLSRRLRKDRASKPALKVADYQPLSDWYFPAGQSGPFGEDTDGPWRSFEETAMSWLAYDIGLIGPDFPAGKWQDIHCRAPIPVTVPNGVTKVNRDLIPA